MTPAELKEWRNARGLSQQAAALEFGYSLSQWQNLEAGITPIRKVLELAIAGYAALSKKREE